MRDGLQLVEQSLLEADVSFDVVQDFMDRVSEQALGQKVLSSLDPSQQVVGIVHDELIHIMGPVDTSIPHAERHDGADAVRPAGFRQDDHLRQAGAAAATARGQLMLVAADLQRPAAIDQLHVIGEQLGIPVYSERGEKDPVKVCREAVAEAKQSGIKVVILDTAGRLAIDQELMDELTRIDREVQPDQAYLVVDGMTGQDAVNSAQRIQRSAGAGRRDHDQAGRRRPRWGVACRSST